MSAKDIVIAAGGSGQISTSTKYVGGKTVTLTPSTGTNTTISLTGLTGGLGGQPESGDLVFVSIAVGATSGGTAELISTGYTEVANLESVDTYETDLYCGCKLMGATPDTSVIVGPTNGTGNGGCVAIQVFRYVDEIFPLQGAANTATFLNTVRPTPPTITPWDQYSIAVIVGAGAHARGNVAYTTTGLNNFISTGSTDTSFDSSIGAGFRIIGTGSYSPNRFDFPQADSSTYSSAAFSVAIKRKPDTVIPTFISYRSGRTNGATLTLTAPTGVQADDLLLLFIVDNTDTPPPFTPPSGFSLSATLQSSSYPRSYIYKKIATSSEPASYTITTTTAVSSFSALLCVFRNANTINTVGAGEFTVSRSPAAPGITPTRGGMLLSVFANESSKTVVTPPPGVTLLGTVLDSPGTAIYYTTAAPYFLTADQQILWSGASGTANQTISYQLQITQE